MGVNDLKNYQRVTVYLRPDQLEYLDSIKDYIGNDLNNNINRSDAIRYMIDVQKSVKPDNELQIRTAIQMLKTKELEENFRVVKP